MESLQLSQVLADLSNLGAAEPEAAAAIVNANNPVARTDTPSEPPTSSGPRQAERPRPSAIQRAWSSEAGLVDKFGRKIKVASPSPRSNSAANSTPGTPRRGESDIDQQVDDDLERASTLMALYDIRAKLKQQDNSSLIKAREKINALAAKQQAQQAAERSAKAAEDLRRNRYSFPKPGL
ncbi:hypothetical protein ACRE_018410 [Hapsidospora chrysogenum ATCC 11550]|uniref:Uncharacterized protein n=1 Tax=Hapsidospora chrysogenum (strain ATCC 11550 / CBS 779.69 / DSM 880 / IAM 14645 / JCM 23072 / IMI 49137) TaxID=857340 RepID=A0A086TD78_HAPC1|nr:hypothetical protein ACRE_018410 [Hapsidospora chrysogenum ATCC 11550]